MSPRTAVLSLGYDSLVKPRLFSIGGGDPEAAHEWTIDALAKRGPQLLGLAGLLIGRPHDPVTVAGIQFPGRVGLAAGVDKDGRAARAWSSLGFSHAELGTVTAQAQPGNPGPRMFRLRDSRAIINRMGFNNAGAAALADRLRGWGVARGQQTLGIPLGISIGKTKVTPVEEAVEDYLISLRLLAPYADYVAVNVSSPNTPGLRALQGKDFLNELARALVTESAAVSGNSAQGAVPVFVKVAPDLTPAELSDVIEVCEARGVAGLIVGNTTLSRDGLAPSDERFADEAGGLSGAPLTVKALETVTSVVRQTSLPVIGVGGIMTPDDGAAMLDAGAQLIQVYSGFIYGGPALVAGLNEIRAPRRRARSHRA